MLGSATVRYVLAAAGARLFAGFAIGAWTAPFYRQYFASHTNSFGVVYAIIVACAGTFSTIAGVQHPLTPPPPLLNPYPTPTQPLPTLYPP